MKLSVYTISYGFSVITLYLFSLEYFLIVVSEKIFSVDVDILKLFILKAT